MNVSLNILMVSIFIMIVIVLMAEKPILVFLMMILVTFQADHCSASQDVSDIRTSPCRHAPGGCGACHDEDCYDHEEDFEDVEDNN